MNTSKDTNKKEVKTTKILKEANLNVKLTQSDYEEIQKIAEDLGGMSISALMRQLIYARLEKYRKSGDPKKFIDDKK